MCQNKAIFGGYNVFGINAEASKSFDSGVDHSKLFISFDLFLIDSWGNRVYLLFFLTMFLKREWSIFSLSWWCLR